MSVQPAMTDWQHRITLQRAARLAREAVVEEKKRRERALHGGGAKEFWDLIDTSGGAESCHEWRGMVDHTWASYPVGKFKLDDIDTTLAHRLVCYLTFGREIPRDHDAMPKCGNRMCCNVDHLVIARHAGPSKMDRAVSAREFYAA